MRADLAALMQQMLGSLAADCYNGSFTEEDEAMFLPDAYIYLPDLEIEGNDRRLVAEAIRRVADSGKKILHILHNWAQKEGEARETGICGHCNSYGYEIDRTKTSGQVRFGYFRIEVQCRELHSECKIESLSVIKLLSLEPWNGKICKERIPASRFDLTNDADTYLRLRNLVGRFARYDYRDWPALLSKQAKSRLDIRPYFDGVPFAPEEYTSKIANLVRQEANNSEMYLFHISSLTNCMFEVLPDDDHANGMAIANLQSFRGAEFGYAEPPYPMDSRFGCFWFAFVREDGFWKISEAIFTDLFQLPKQKYSNERDFKHSDADFERPPMPERRDEAVNAADIFEIESIISWWVDYLKRGESECFPDRFMVNRSEEISMNLSNHTFRGYDEIMGRCRELIGPFLERYPSLRNYPQIHSANTPVIEFDPDGTHALGTWYDMAFGNIGGNIFYPEEEVRRAYFPGLGVYYHSFVRDGNRWKLYKFRCKISGIWGLEPWPFDTRQVGGWAQKKEKAAWPLPFEKFHY